MAIASSSKPVSPIAKDAAMIGIALGLMVIILMMILPMPAWVLDMGLAASFALAVLIFTLTLFVDRPLDFSAFPTVLLTALMLRLALNISSTKLILSDGHTGTAAAGHVIRGFAEFIMGGSLALGLVVFGVLLIVNFMVITKGAARMAEVAARFALDGMPGKQLAIDSDLAAGAISHDEARRKRADDQAEVSFFGSLDGASKFVKGDAVAGLLITLLNLVMGTLMGIISHNMSPAAAFQTYAVLTIGDGLVTQVPAVIISIASGLLLARGGAGGALDVAVLGQFAKYPSALGTVAALMAAFAAFPGLPALPFLLGASLIGAVAYRLARGQKNAPDCDAAIDATTQPAPAATLGDLMDMDDIHVEFAPNLVDLVLDPATGLEARIATMRRHVAVQFGLVLPEIRLSDDAERSSGCYAIRIQGAERGQGKIMPDHALILLNSGTDGIPKGIDTHEPVYQAPARWIEKAQQEEAAISGATVVSPAEVLATHLLEVIKENLGRLMTLKVLRRTLDTYVGLSDPARADENRKLIDDIVPDRLPRELLHGVLRDLLEERVSIRNLSIILEAAAEARSSGLRPDAMTEHVRQRLGLQLVAPMTRPDGALPLLQLDPKWEEIFQRYEVAGAGGLPDIGLPPEQFNRLSDGIRTAISDVSVTETGVAIAVPAPRRRFLRTLVTAHGLAVPVLSFEEIGLNARPAIVGVIPI